MLSVRCLSVLYRSIRNLASSTVRPHNFDGEAYSKTNLTFISEEDSTHNYIDQFTPSGFRLTSGFFILGPCVVFPRTILQWNVHSADKITPESLSLFTMLEPKLDVLLIGKGDWDAKVDPSVIKYLRQNKINMEILPTEQACATFNFLNEERRVVAAALIPPSTMTFPYEEEQVEQPSEDEEDAKFKEIMESMNKIGIRKTIEKYEQIKRESKQIADSSKKNADE
ncbi:NADH dehydrogenase [ubiquinone] 1 alpha subcomplex assembly factor 3-like [Physella acuta]|uniref:NADH dehydrogenase [ubiquinone] 1 alpha subcomplex assembly factor 3-like n=1 Tax=Physella acuta TaxID=109671 RepID=UPI0027DCDDBE|nr:NADH dehydrogenase [ubiquinone] 1 alpha subcomplex assembly factor 3-like [Physella acuta]XP_059138659.1 NADH dehydrogenase [ubiquinone] 1 alpha subcomplex assembly factor 3-like [Physella acuta]